jgi:hypothetical protein
VGEERGVGGRAGVGGAHGGATGWPWAAWLGCRSGGRDRLRKTNRPR